jgi:serine O-acetyltransferase
MPVSRDSTFDGGLRRTPGPFAAGVGGVMAGDDHTAAPPEIGSFRALRAHLREDYATNHRAFWAPGFQAAAVYRLGVWCNGIRPKLLRAPVRLAYWFLNFIVRTVYGIELYATARIGRRLRIAHQHGIVIHPHAVLGDDCIVRQGVSIGTLRPGRKAPPPVLGDRVEIGAGAVIVGPVRIGDDVVIGPNAVVTTNVPAGAIVASPQSRIVMPPPRRRPADAAPAPAAAGREDRETGT